MIGPAKATLRKARFTVAKVVLKVLGAPASRSGHLVFQEKVTITRAEPRPGEQRSGAPAPHGELSGQRDSQGTEEAIDQSGNSTVFNPPDSSPGAP